jgi:3-hydroxypropanoate dehydrogenase
MTQTVQHTGLDEAAANALFRHAHTTYSFDNIDVSEGELATVYDLMRHAPTAMNTQPLRITFIRSEVAKARLMPHLAAGNRAKSESAPVVAILAADTDFHEHLPRLAPHLTNAKTAFADAEARAQAAHFNATLQAGYFILAVRAAGLAAGPMGGFDKSGVDAEFFGGTPLRSFLVVNIGHAAPDGTRPRAPRLEWHEAVVTL